MQLHVARMCLDCEEIHDQQSCPVCASESFAYISRWIPAPERRAHPRAVPSPESADVYRELLHGDRHPSGATRWIRRGALGLAAVGLAGWAWSRRGAAAEEKIGKAAGASASDDKSG